MFKNPKIYTFTVHFILPFYLILMPTKDYTIGCTSIDKLTFFLMS